MTNRKIYKLGKTIWTPVNKRWNGLSVILYKTDVPDNIFLWEGDLLSMGAILKSEKLKKIAREKKE